MQHAELWLHVQNSVDHKLAPDYARYVAKKDEMDLAKIGRKISGARYTGASGLLADLQQIVRNADAYNAPGCGIYGGPGAHACLQVACWLHTVSPLDAVQPACDLASAVCAMHVALGCSVVLVQTQFCDGLLPAARHTPQFIVIFALRHP